MTERPILAVLGATGAQGGGVVRAALDDPARPYRVRAITRDPSSERARALDARGAEVVRADLDDAESLARVLAGTDAAFAVTNFWEHASPERELRQAHNIAEAAARAGVRHVVWSTLEDTRERVPLDEDRMPTLLGRYKVPHFDAKGEADRRFRELGVPTTFLRTSFYWDNLIHFGMGPRRADDGVAELALPMGDHRLAGIAADDIGACAYALVRRGAAVGETVGIAGEHLTGHDMAARLSAAMRETVRYRDVPVAAYREFGFAGAEDLGNMFQYYQEFEEEVCGGRPIERTRALYAGLQSFDAWLARHVARIPVMARAAA